MKLTDLTSEHLIHIGTNGNTKEEIMDELIASFHDQNVISSKEEFKKAILKREAESTTGIGFGIAIPHGKSNAVQTPSVAFALKKEGVDWMSLDGEPSQLIFMIAVPEESNNEHLKILQMLSRKLMDDEFREELIAANTKEDVLRLLENIQ